jgi:hypothetical protein
MTTTDPREPPTPSVPLADWLDHLSPLDLTALDVAVRFRAPVDLADPACAVVRGLLGERLRDFRCLTRAPTCEGCSETAACDYARVFGGEVDLAGLPGWARGLHPYWLQGLPAAAEIHADARFTARLVVAGFAVPVLPYLDVALRDALARLGAHPRERAPELSASRIARVTLPPAPPAEGARCWRIETLTPLVLRGDMDACARACPQAPWLALLVRAGVRRLGALQHAFSPAPAPWADLPALDDVEVIEGRMERWHGSRMSRRQGQRFPLDGLVGSAVVQGSGMAVTGRLLEALAVTSVGKSTTMGFGAMTAEPIH